MLTGAHVRQQNTKSNYENAIKGQVEVGRSRSGTQCNNNIRKQSNTKKTERLNTAWAKEDVVLFIQKKQA